MRRFGPRCPPPVVPGGELGDGGLQVERTALAWERTECAVAISAVIELRIAVHNGHPLLMGFTVFAVFAAAVLVVGRWSSRLCAARSGCGDRSISKARLEIHVIAAVVPALGLVALCWVLGLA